MSHSKESTPEVTSEEKPIVWTDQIGKNVQVIFLGERYNGTITAVDGLYITVTRFLGFKGIKLAPVQILIEKGADIDLLYPDLSASNTRPKEPRS